MFPFWLAPGTTHRSRAPGGRLLGDRVNAAQRELCNVLGQLRRGRPDRGDWATADLAMLLGHGRVHLRLNAQDATLHHFIIGVAMQDLGDRRRHVVETRLDDAFHDEVERGRRIRHLTHHQLMDPIVTSRPDHPFQEHANIRTELVFRWPALPRRPRRIGRRTHGLDCRGQHFLVQAQLAAEVVVHCRDVRMRLPADLAHGDASEAARGKQLGGDRQQTAAGFRILFGHSLADATSVPDTKLSALSSMSANFGSLRASTRREKSG